MHRVKCLKTRTPLLWMNFRTRLTDSEAFVDTIRSLVVRGQSDPMHVDRHGINFLTGYYGTSSGHLWLLNQEEFESDILQCGDLAIHAISHTFANPFMDKNSSPPEGGGASLRKLLRAGVVLASVGPEIG